MKVSGVILALIVAIALVHAVAGKHTALTGGVGQGVQVGRIAVSHDDDTMHFLATCTDQGVMVTLHPDTAITRPAAIQACRKAGQSYAALSAVARSGH